MAHIRSVHHARELARRRLPAPLYVGVESGSGADATLRANEAAYMRYGFRPRAAVTYPARNLTTHIVGTKVAMPLMTGPCGGLRLIHPQGDVAVARAARSMGTLSAVSFLSGHTIEEVGAARDGPIWKQLYLTRGRAHAEDVISRAQASGYTALVVTVSVADMPRIPKHRRSLLNFLPSTLARPGWLLSFIRDGMSVDPAGNRFENANYSARWEDFAWIRALWKGPLIVKGIVTRDDARRALDVGAAAIVVSNHGGKGLDGAPATLAALPEVVAAVGKETEVLLDGGIRSGADAIKAIALGARAVLIGRPYIWGLAAGGESGVRRILEIFRDEMDTTLSRMGCGSIAELDASYVQQVA